MIDLIRLSSGRLVTLVRCEHCHERIVNRQRGVVLMADLASLRTVHTALVHRRCARAWLHHHGSNQHWEHEAIPALFFVQRDQPVLQVINYFRKVATVGVWLESSYAPVLAQLSA